MIFTTLSSVAITVEQSSFTYNQAGGDGGVICMRSVGKSGSSKVTARGSRFGFNNASGRGGLTAITGGQVDLQESQIYNNTAESGGVVSACISEVKVQMELWVMDEPTNPQLCIFYDTENNFANFTPPIISGSDKFIFTPPIISGSDKFISTLNAALGIAIVSCALVLLLCVIVICIILYLRGVLKCYKREEADSGVDNSQLYVSIN